MGIISAGAHRALDFVLVLVLALAPTLFGMTGRSAMVTWALAAVHLLVTLFTHVPGRESRPISYQAHGALELLVGLAMIAVPLLRNWTGGARTFYLGFGVVLLLVWLLTRYREPVARVTAPPPPAV